MWQGGGYEGACDVVRNNSALTVIPERLTELLEVHVVFYHRGGHRCHRCHRCCRASFVRRQRSSARHPFFLGAFGNKSTVGGVARGEAEVG